MPRKAYYNPREKLVFLDLMTMDEGVDQMAIGDLPGNPALMRFLDWKVVTEQKVDFGTPYWFHKVSAVSETS